MEVGHERGLTVDPHPRSWKNVHDGPHRVCGRAQHCKSALKVLSRPHEGRRARFSRYVNVDPPRHCSGSHSSHAGTEKTGKKCIPFRMPALTWVKTTTGLRAIVPRLPTEPPVPLPPTSPLIESFGNCVVGSSWLSRPATYETKTMSAKIRTEIPRHPTNALQRVVDSAIPTTDKWEGVNALCHTWAATWNGIVGAVDKCKQKL